MLQQTVPELIMAYLPTELADDILPHLPVSTLLRFRCVSKPWRALIDSPDFIKLHLNRSIETRNNRSLIVKHSPFYSLNLDSLDVTVEIDLSLKVIGVQGNSLQVVGCCNGLVLLIYERHIGCAETIFLLNPFTKKYHRLPTAPHRFAQSETYGIGYDSVNDDYKVVKIIQWETVYCHTFYSEVNIYSLNSNTWRTIRDFPYNLVNQRYGVFCGGALHWIVSDKFSGSRSVAAVGLAAENYQLVPMPNWTYQNDLYNQVAVLEGCLCMCNHKKERIDVWVMKNYRVGESWMKLFSVSLPVNNMSYELFNLLALSKDGTQVLYMHHRDGRGLIWFDLERKLEKRVDVHGLPRRFRAEFFIQSLVSLGSGSQSYGMKHHREEAGFNVKN